MKRKLAAWTLLLCLTLTGCAGTTVVYQEECDCPEEGQTTPENQEAAGDAVKTGLAVVTDISGSRSAAQADYDVVFVALTVDDAGVIRSCIIDGLGAQVAFDDTGTITGDVTAPVQTKNELGENYGMKAYGGAKYEWYEQAAALADYAVGKTADQLRSGAIDSAGYALDADLASTATIYLGGLVSAIEQAAARARHCGARAGDTLRLAVIADTADSTSAAADSPGRVRLNCDVTALTLSGGTITGCRIDSLQADVTFDATGAISTDLTAAVKTKTELGEDYGMQAYGGAKYEWYEQAANFAAYVTGKTAAEVAGIAVSDGKALNADLAATVTISITPFQALIAKACG